MKLLLDENLPHRLRVEIPGHQVMTVAYMRWSGISNGRLLTLAADQGFDVLITNDRGLEYEQDQGSLPVGVIILMIPSNTMSSIRPLYPQLQAVLQTIRRGNLVKVSASEVE